MIFLGIVNVELSSQGSEGLLHSHNQHYPSYHKAADLHPPPSRLWSTTCVDLSWTGGLYRGARIVPSLNCVWVMSFPNFTLILFHSFSNYLFSIFHPNFIKISHVFLEHNHFCRDFIWSLVCSRSNPQSPQTKIILDRSKRWMKDFVQPLSS